MEPTTLKLPTPPHEIQRLGPAHHRMVDLALEGMTRNQVAEKMGRSPEGVGIIMNSPLFQAEVARRRELQNGVHAREQSTNLTKAREVLEEAIVPAAQTLTNLLHSSDENIQRHAAKDIFSLVYGEGQSPGKSVTNITQNQFNILVQALGEDDKLHRKVVQELVS